MWTFIVCKERSNGSWSVLRLGLLSLRLLLSPRVPTTTYSWQRRSTSKMSWFPLSTSTELNPTNTTLSLFPYLRSLQGFHSNFSDFLTFNPVPSLLRPLLLLLFILHMSICWSQITYEYRFEERLSSRNPFSLSLINY